MKPATSLCSWRSLGDTRRCTKVSPATESTTNRETAKMPQSTVVMAGLASLILAALYGAYTPTIRVSLGERNVLVHECLQQLARRLTTRPQSWRFSLHGIDYPLSLGKETQRVWPSLAASP